ncbi:uncharacterized protein LOC119609909 [Lucilia sericata]|uniref:uncharacterized protein LOC119609909 n=1 Tax=Lucilia sericata TaxID=13632 RepID=UPI0018A882EA|nr:uncharacterized protein LOC119609909 [Lucilia sericata]
MGHYVNFAVLSDIQTSNQIQLYEAFLKSDLKLFTNALEKGANPLMKYPDEDLCVLYQALQTPGSSEFIWNSMSRGYEPINVTNFCYQAVKYVCKSEDFDNFKVFVNCCSLYPAWEYVNLFLLNSLIKKLNNANVKNIKQFIEVIFKARVSPNIPDQEGITPLQNVVKNIHLNYDNKCQIIKMLLSSDNINIDTFGQGELRKILEMDYTDIR